MKYPLFIIIFVCFQFFAVNLFSQSAAEIIDKHIAAMGGLENINRINSIRITSRYISDTVNIPSTLIVKGKDKIRIELEIAGKNFIQACNGNSGWFFNPFVDSTGVEKMDKEDLADIRDDGQWEGKLVNYKEKGSTAELLDSEDKGSVKIKLTDINGKETLFYLDANTYLINKQVTKFNIEKKEVTQEVFPEDYRANGGVMFAMKSKTKLSNDKVIQDRIIDKIEINIHVEDAIFEKP